MNLTFTKRSAKHGDPCQLCRPDDRTHQAVAQAYATVCGVRLCRGHLLRVASIVRYAKSRRRKSGSRSLSGVGRANHGT